MYVCIDRSKIRISARRKTTTAEGVPEGLPEATNSIGVFRITTNKTAAKEREQLESEAMKTDEQKQVRREQACVNFER